MSPIDGVRSSRRLSATRHAEACWVMRFAALRPRVRGQNRPAAGRGQCQSDAGEKILLAEERRNQHQPFCPIGRTFALCGACLLRDWLVVTRGLRATSGPCEARADVLRPICRAVGNWQACAKKTRVAARAGSADGAAD